MRLTKDMRANILRTAMAQVPTIDYPALLVPLLQEVFCKHMPPEVKAVYDNPETRPYLKQIDVWIKDGNGYGTKSMKPETKGTGYHGEFFGASSIRSIDIQVDERAVSRLKKGTLYYDLTHAVVKSGYFDKHIEQQQLLADVRKRLGATLDAASTVKKLYDVLEPELYYLIPKEDDKSVKLPAMAAPVVDDLRKLGAVLPAVPTKK